MVQYGTFIILCPLNKMNETENWIANAVELWVHLVKTRKKMSYYGQFVLPEKLPPSVSAKKIQENRFNEDEKRSSLTFPNLIRQVSVHRNK